VERHATKQSKLKRVPMDDLVWKSLAICQPQMQNTSGKIFGGFLMRNAFETAWASAYLFALRQYDEYSHQTTEEPQTHECRQPHPFLLCVDDISFLHPVEIGSVIEFRSHVVYSTGRAIHIRVETHSRPPHSQGLSFSPSFSFSDL